LEVLRDVSREMVQLLNGKMIIDERLRAHA